MGPVGPLSPLSPLSPLIPLIPLSPLSPVIGLPPDSRFTRPLNTRPHFLYVSRMKATLLTPCSLLAAHLSGCESHASQPSVGLVNDRKGGNRPKAIASDRKQ